MDFDDLAVLNWLDYRHGGGQLGLTSAPAFTVAELATSHGMTDQQAVHRVSQLIDLEYVETDQGSRGNPGSWFIRLTGQGREALAARLREWVYGALANVIRGSVGQTVMLDAVLFPEVWRHRNEIDYALHRIEEWGAISIRRGVDSSGRTDLSVMEVRPKAMDLPEHINQLGMPTDAKADSPVPFPADQRSAASVESERSKSGTRRFRVAFSFAGEKRQYVEQVADILGQRFGKDKVLYDRYHTAEFSRSDLAFYLPDRYEKDSDLIVAVLCRDYEKKEWCGLEWNAIYGMIKRREVGAVMLTRFDRVEGEGLRGLAGYLDLDNLTPQQAAESIMERLALNEGTGRIVKGTGKGRAEPNGTTKDRAARQRDHRPTRGITTDKLLAFIFGVVFVVLLAILALCVPNPTSFQYTVFRVILSLAAAGVAAVVPGFLAIDLSRGTVTAVRAGGALAVFVVVYFANPAKIAGPPPGRSTTVPVITNEDVHLGDNIYPPNWGFSHNPLHLATYPQDAQGIVYYDKETRTFLAGHDKQTVIGRMVAEFMKKQIAHLDFSGYATIRAHQSQGAPPSELQRLMSSGQDERFVQTDPSTILYATRSGPGDFYERYAAVGIVRAVDFSMPLTNANMEFTRDKIASVSLHVECYHGGIRAGQDHKFCAILNGHTYPLATTSHVARDKEVVVAEINPDHVEYSRENVVALTVLPWQEERPKSFTTGLGPAHFRDVGIIRAFFKLTEVANN